MTGIESCRKGDKRMKQAEHPPATAGASIAAEYSLALIDQLARIDRFRSKEEMDELGLPPAEFDRRGHAV